ncbi:zeta toxin family protein [Pectobacterium brasiliense]|uniref:zeta toxin family protein n=1 Tax=Pectobacterium brasiliense TaxID=180957 RepID=UPI0015DF9BA7|nr:zeta toxin family protein [Pectobacterium brasiliense]MBA0217438.1 zeta toxin family protein [Pectobacterium brasiliense]MBN3071741.1 zeta toxin family protein [Pectobacterium brasiliense]MBN3168598.1 zeta toxin family protein [Pectobacterium brasiliense]
MEGELLTPLSRKVGKAVKEVLYEHLTTGKTPTESKAVLFMAGSPAAGKTELLNRLIEQHKLSNFVRIDADDFRWWFPYYNEENSVYFQKAASEMVDYIYKRALSDGYQIIMDSTFSSLSIAESNFDRALNANYSIMLNYVYFAPEKAWSYAKERKRTVPLEILKRNFIKSREVIVNMLKTYDGKFTLNIYHRYESPPSSGNFSVETKYNVTQSTWAASHPCSYNSIDDLAHIGV